MKNVGARHHLTSRKGVWYYRRRVPENLIDAIGRGYWQESLRTTDLKEAQRRRTVKDLEADAFIAMAEAEVSQAGAGSTAPAFLTTEALVSHLRAYVDDRHRQFVTQADSEALSPEERREVVRGVEDEISVLTNPHDPRHDEWIGQVGDRVLKALGHPLGQRD